MTKKINPSRFFKTAFFLAAACFFSLKMQAQQTPYVSFYRQNWQMINPASMDPWTYKNSRGWRSMTMVTASYRSQWVTSGIEGTPALMMASVEHSPDLRAEDQPFKFGGVFFKDRAAAFGTIGASLTGSYFWEMGEGFFHVGGSAGIIQYGIDKSKANPADPSDLIWADAGRRILPEFSIGALYRDDLNYVGLSIPQTASEVIAKTRKSHVYFVWGHFFEPQDYVKVELSNWIRYTPGLTYRSISKNGKLPISTDVNCRVFFDKMKTRSFDKIFGCWAGAGIGTGMNAQIEGGIEIERGFENYERRSRLRLGVSYGFPFTKTYNPLGQSFEVTAAMAFN